MVRRQLKSRRLWMAAAVQCLVIVAGAVAGWMFGLQAGAGSVVLALVASLNAAVFCALSADALLSRWARQQAHSQRM